MRGRSRKLEAGHLRVRRRVGLRLGRALRDPSAPSLDRTLVEEVVRNGAASVGGPGPDYVEVHRVAEAGPCALIRVRVGAPPPTMEIAGGLGLVLGTGFSLLLVVGLATWFVLRPLLERIEGGEAPGLRVVVAGKCRS
jgi:hypothetical protein